jgi:hypothetical protein
MPKHFNVAGPCRGDDHYMLSPEARLTELRPLIEEKAYFVVHAPRQTGKTTSLTSLARRLTAEGTYAAILTSCKVGEVAGADIARGIPAIVRALDLNARKQLPEELRPEPLDSLGNPVAEVLLLEHLSRWCERCPRPVVLFLDEIDALKDQTLLSVLDQLHAGYDSRPDDFPHSLALAGLRDVRDYEIRQDGEERFGSSSPLNIKLESLLLRDFNAGEVAELYAQHTQATGQRFSDKAVEMAFRLTGGQPWLVNALARQVVMREVPDPKVTIEARHLDDATEALILRRDTHLDSLVKRLRQARQARVRRIVEPILGGDPLSMDVLSDDLAFVKDLGLVRSSSQGLEIANPIYREIVPRALTSIMEESLVLPRPSYLDAEGRLDVDQLLEDFSVFWIANAEIYLRQTPYSEAAALLVIMAFLHKITNGKGGFIDREYAAGRGSVDLCIRWPLPTGEVLRWALELKVWRDTTPCGEGILDPIEQGLFQLTKYLERLGLDRGYLIVFDARSDAAPLPQRVSREEAELEGRSIVLWRL